MSEPTDAGVRRAIAPVICYPVEELPKPDLGLYQRAAAGAVEVAREVAAPREAACVKVPAGSFLRITSVEGAQVGDLNLFAQSDLAERFYSGKTRALHGTHVSAGDQL